MLSFWVTTTPSWDPTFSVLGRDSGRNGEVLTSWNSLVENGDFESQESQ